MRSKPVVLLASSFPRLEFLMKTLPQRHQLGSRACRAVPDLGQPGWLVHPAVIFRAKEKYYEKNVILQNCSFQLDLQILSDIASDKKYIFHFNLKKYDLCFSFGRVIRIFCLYFTALFVLIIPFILNLENLIM